MFAQVMVAQRAWWHGRQKLLAEIGFLFMVMVWGGAFVLTKNALQEIGPFAYNTLRMSLGALCLALVAGSHWRRARWWWAMPVLLTAAVVVAGYSLQAYGQQFTTASKAGFLTGINVVYVPILAALFLRHKPTLFQMGGVLLAFGGLSLISLEGDWRQLQFGQGDGYVAASGLFWALYVIALAYFGRRIPILPFASLHVAAAAVGSGLLWWLFEAQPIAWGAPALWWGVVVTGVLILGFGTGMQAQVLRLVHPTRAALIAALEPLFAAVAGWLVGELLTSSIFIGGALILLGMMASELGGKGKSEK